MWGIASWKELRSHPREKPQGTWGWRGHDAHTTGCLWGASSVWAAPGKCHVLPDPTLISLPVPSVPHCTDVQDRFLGSEQRRCVSGGWKRKLWTWLPSGVLSFTTQLCELEQVTWTLCLGLLICKMGILIAPPSEGSYWGLPSSCKVLKIIQCCFIISSIPSSRQKTNFLFCEVGPAWETEHGLNWRKLLNLIHWFIQHVSWLCFFFLLLFSSKKATGKTQLF